MLVALAAIWNLRSYAPWAIVVLAVGWGLWERGEYEKCSASIATEAAKAEQLVQAQRDADAKFTRGLEEKLAPITQAIQEQANATQVALAKVPSNPSCAHTPATGAFDSSVRTGGQQAAPGAARPAAR